MNVTRAILEKKFSLLPNSASDSLLVPSSASLSSSSSSNSSKRVSSPRKKRKRESDSNKQEELKELKELKMQSQINPNQTTNLQTGINRTFGKKNKQETGKQTEFAKKQTPANSKIETGSANQKKYVQTKIFNYSQKTLSPKCSTPPSHPLLHPSPNKQSNEFTPALSSSRTLEKIFEHKKNEEISSLNNQTSNPNNLSDDSNNQTNSSNTETNNSRAGIGREGKKKVQSFLDLGQKGLHGIECKECGMRYNPGVKEDEKLHKTFHETKVKGIKIGDLKQVNEVKRFHNDDSKVVCSLSGGEELPSHFNKFKEVKEMIDSELGFVDEEEESMVEFLKHKKVPFSNFFLIFFFTFFHYIKDVSSCKWK